MIMNISDPQHERHARGLVEALADRRATYKCDPNPYMRRTRDPLTGQPLKVTPVQKLAKMPFVTLPQMMNFRKKALKVMSDMSCDL